MAAVLTAEVSHCSRKFVLSLSFNLSWAVIFKNHTLAHIMDICWQSWIILGYRNRHQWDWDSRMWGSRRSVAEDPSLSFTVYAVSHHKTQYSQYKSQHWTRSNIIQGTLNLHWIIRIQKQDCHQFITNIYVILRKLLTFYTYNMKDKRNSFPGFYIFGQLIAVIS
jgi:hypothetical protein